jgi:hypothetical protein
MWVGTTHIHTVQVHIDYIEIEIERLEVCCSCLRRYIYTC